MKPRVVGIRLTEGQYQHLKQKAAEENRPLANLLNVLINRGLRASQANEEYDDNEENQSESAEGNSWAQGRKKPDEGP